MPAINTGKMTPDARNSVAIRNPTAIQTLNDLPASVGEAFTASRLFQKREGNLTSAANAAEPFIQERNTLINETTGLAVDVLESTRYESAGLVNRINRFIDNGQIVRDDNGNITANTPKARTWLRVNPAIATVEYAKRDTQAARPKDYLTDSLIIERVAADLGKKRAETDAIRRRATTPLAIAAEFAGAAVGFVQDLPQAVTLFAGAGPIRGGGILGNALKAFRTEAIIAGAIEVPVQTEALLFKRDIGSPYTMKEAAFNVLAVVLGAGFIRSGGSITLDVAEKAVKTYRTRVASGDVVESPESAQAADIIDKYVESADDLPGVDSADNPQNIADHFEAVSKATEDINTNQPVSVEPFVEPELQPRAVQEIPGNRVFTSDDIEAFDPTALEVDAETFQFKSGGDDLGVTTAFRDIDNFNIEQSGLVIVFEDLAGKQFIVDGHQRMGIARRALEAGQDPASVRLMGLTLRASDGVTPAEARAVAAFKNIAEGTGTGLDAAKVFRDLGEAGMAYMPRLPAAGVIARRGRNLARLNDDSFRAVINEVVPEDQAAIVGELIAETKLQQAAIDALAKVEPANQVQAREVIKQVREAGVVSRETGDLFGGEINESLILERAKVVDRALRELRGAKRTFATLVNQEDTITGTGGNVLDRASNEQQVIDNAVLAEILQRDAHTKGPVSDAVQTAAERLKAGENPAAISKSFLGDIEAAVARGDGAGIEPGETRLEAPAVADDTARPAAPEGEPSNPIDSAASQSEKADNLNLLSDENEGIINALLVEIDAKFNAESKSSRKTKDSIIGKANRPGILDKKPWFNVEYLHDSFRFRTVVNNIDDAGEIVAFMRERPEMQGVEIIRVDIDKQLKPLDWGWRMVALDMKMQNGQIVEFYLPTRELREALKGERPGQPGNNHDLFEKWRATDITKLTQEQTRAYLADLETSRNWYDEAWQAYLARTGQTEAEVSDSLSKLADSLASASTKSQLRSSPVRDMPGSELQPDSVLNRSPASARTTADTVDSPGSRGTRTRGSGIDSTSTDSISEGADITTGTDLAGPVDLQAQALSDATRAADIRRNGTRDVAVGESDFFGRLETDLFEDAEAAAVNSHARSLLDDTDVEIPTQAELIDGETVLSTTSARSALDDIDAQEVQLDDLIGCHSGEAA